MDNVIQAVVDELKTRGLIVSHEHPGVVLADSNFYAGTANGTWGVDKMSDDGAYLLDTRDTYIPACNRDVSHIATAIMNAMADMRSRTNG
jgi:hypothetical protein